MNKFVFYLMNEKGEKVLTDFLDKIGSSHLEYIVLSEDNSVEKDYFAELKELCVKNNIQFYLRNEEIPIYEGYKIAIGWRWLISDTDKLIVLHDSILPKYRGFSPLVNMLINGEEEIGVTALFASSEYDKGNIILQKKISVHYPLKIKKAIEQVSKLYSEIVSKITLQIIRNSEIYSTPQKEEDATYSLWRDEKDYFIDWSLDAKRIKRMVDALGFPYLGAKTLLNGEIIILEEVEELPDLYVENRDFGKLIMNRDGYPIIVCGQGLLKIIKGKYLDGRSILPFKNFRSRLGE